MLRYPNQGKEMIDLDKWTDRLLEGLLFVYRVSGMMFILAAGTLVEDHLQSKADIVNNPTHAFFCVIAKYTALVGAVFLAHMIDELWNLRKRLHELECNTKRTEREINWSNRSLDRLLRRVGKLELRK